MSSLMKRYQDRLRREEAAKEVDRLVSQSIDKRSNEYSIAVNIIIAFVLHNAFGFGRDRLVRFFRQSNKMQREMKDRYDDADFFAMEKKLKDDGIDVRAWYEDADSNDIGFTEI